MSAARNPYLQPGPMSEDIARALLPMLTKQAIAGHSRSLAEVLRICDALHEALPEPVSNMLAQGAEKFVRGEIVDFGNYVGLKRERGQRGDLEARHRIECAIAWEICTHCKDFNGTLSLDAAAKIAAENCGVDVSTVYRSYRKVAKRNRRQY